MNLSTIINNNSNITLEAINPFNGVVDFFDVTPKDINIKYKRSNVSIRINARNYLTDEVIRFQYTVPEANVEMEIGDSPCEVYIHLGNQATLLMLASS